MSGSDILVIGGGLHGLSAALHLARACASVRVLEADFVGRHASGASAAGVRTLGRNIKELPLSITAMDAWHRIADLVGDDCGFHANGQLRVAETEAQQETEIARIVRLHALGYENERIIGQNELLSLVPGINPKFVSAAYAEKDGAADPHRTLVAFRAAAERAGVDIREHARVHGVARLDGKWAVSTAIGTFVARTVVNAAGAWGAHVASMVGETIPLSAKASMMMVTERLAQSFRPVVSIVGRSLSFKQSSQGTLVLGGGIQGRYDLDTGRTFIDFAALAKGAAAARELFPAVTGARITRCWSGIEGKTQDLLPVICPSSQAEDFFHVFGFSGHGFQLVPVVGAAVRDMVTSGAVPADLRPFDAKRLTSMEAAA